MTKETQETAKNWWRPQTIGQMVFSVRRGFAFAGMGLRGDYVAVCSPRPSLDESHPLSAHVITGAERYHDDYMSGKGRTPHPSVVTYYVVDPSTRRVVVAVQADGTILEEIEEQLGHRSQKLRDALREAIRETPADKN